MADPTMDQPGPELADVLAAASRGDEAAWRRVLEWYGRRVFALAKSRCQRVDLAEEITQSVFATVAAKLGGGEYTEQGRFEPWLFRVAMNRIRDEMRRRKRQADSTDPAVFGTLAGPADPGFESELGPRLEQLRAALERLSESDREVIELRHHAGLSFKQMSDLLEEPLGTLLARHHRTLRKLKAMLEENERESRKGHHEHEPRA